MTDRQYDLKRANPLGARLQAYLLQEQLKQMDEQTAHNHLDFMRAKPCWL